MINLSLSENVLSSLPGHVLIKEIYQEKARWVWANDCVAKIAGFKNGDAAIGIYDEQMQCDAAKYVANFLEADKKSLSGKSVKTVDIYTYSDGNKHMLIGTRKLIADTDNYKIMFHGTSMRLADFKSADFCSIFVNNLMARLVGKQGCETYSIEQVIDGLSQKESQCFFYWIRGYTAKEIAQKLHRSHRTVEIHLANIKTKLGVQSKSQLIDWAIQHHAFSIVPSQLLNGSHIINE